MKYKVISVSGEKKIQNLLNDMRSRGWRLVTFRVRDHIYNFVAVFARE